MSIGAGHVLMLDARLVSQQWWVCAPLLPHRPRPPMGALRSVDPFGEDDRRCMADRCASNGRNLWLSLQ
jgi:hypothetical protein